MKMRLVLMTVCAGSLALPLGAADWPQFRGPRRDGHAAEKDLLTQWPAQGPALAWTYDQTGQGYSGPAIVGDKLFILGARGDAEFLIALDLHDDKVKELWALKIGPVFTWKGNNWNVGPSATPTVDGDLVFALGGGGTLVCAGVDGKEVWRKNLPAYLSAEINPIGGGPEKLGWGFAWSPLVDGAQLLCVPGGGKGHLAALDKKTGALLWQSKELTGQATYASPLVAEIGGVRQYVQMLYDGVAAVAAQDGKLLWHYRRKQPYKDCVIPTPIIQADHVYMTVGFGEGCDLVKVSKKDDAFQVTQVSAYRPNKIAKAMQNQNGGVVLVDEHVYGYADGKGWICQEFKTGATIWSEKNKLGRGSLLYAEGRLYLFGEDDGIVVLLEAGTKGWKENGRFELPRRSKHNLASGRLWTHPVLAHGQLFLRDQELLFCFKVQSK